MDTPIKKLKIVTTNRLNVLKTLSHTTWVEDTQILMKIYKSLILSKLNYSSILYTTAKKSALKIIEPIHNTCLCIAIGAFKSSPIESIYAISGKFPVHIRKIYT